MKIAITGSSGYLGRCVTAAALSRGHEVVGIDIKPSGIRDGRFSEHLIDIADGEAVNRAVKGVDAVFHLAAALAQFVRDEKRMQKTNVDGTANILKAAKVNKIKKLVYTSSVEVYGIDVPTPCPEDAPMNPICQYGREKVECEKMCRDYGREGLDITIFRPPTINGPGQNEPFLVSQMEAVYRGKATLLPGGGRSRLQMVDVADVADALFLALEHPKAVGAVMNLGSDNVPTLRGMAQALYEHIGRRPKFISIPALPARIVVRGLSAMGLSPIEPQHLEIALKDYVFDNSRAKELIGWRPKKDDIESAKAAFDDHIKRMEVGG
ncbi:MAG: NAD(P)-dependent oxidoreductase [Deltaproteobacteria bacterium]|uniref:NAD(P)-dependent oxidoreductase n=1 Tax=Candidatus Zymogenus saltonus TaxID=2844893 RepID=A0A9D8PQ41_9DELT|nr:NAD(P)-dependent oxidoreductase [Candidatus Zymogenus saltonus]